MSEQGELDRIAREAAPEVLAAALVRARTQAEARLADLLTDAIVARAPRRSRRPCRGAGPRAGRRRRGAPCTRTPSAGRSCATRQTVPR